MFIRNRALIKKSLAALMFGGLGLTVLPATSEAGKNITRSCHGGYFVKYRMINGIIPNDQRRYFGKFTATRSCGRTVPNRCRERARSAILSCGSVAYAERWNRNNVPSHCSSVAGIKGYEIPDLKNELEKAACCHEYAKTYKDVTVELYVKSEGDRGCGDGVWPVHRRLETTYKIDCRDARKRLCS